MSRSRLIEQIITGRLLVVQSKRLILNSLERRLEETGNDAMRERVDHLRLEAAEAQHKYKTSMLHWGTPDYADYWTVAYSRLVDMGGALTRKLSASIDALPPDEQYEAAIDIEMLERIVRRWGDSVRDAMAESVA